MSHEGKVVKTSKGRPMAKGVCPEYGYTREQAEQEFNLWMKKQLWLLLGAVILLAILKIIFRSVGR